MDTRTSQPRITPAGSPLGTFIAAAAGRVTHTEPLRIFTTLSRHRRLFRSWLPLACVLLLRGDLPRADRELLVLRTAWNCGCWYEWVQHAGMATSHGLAPQLIDAIPGWSACAWWSPRQRHLLRAADELHDLRVITDDTWAGLAGELRDTELIELCFLVGHYEMLAMTLNSLDVQPEPGALRAITGSRAQVAGVLRAVLRSARGAPT